jgi:hypothetical protein
MPAAELFFYLKNHRRCLFRDAELSLSYLFVIPAGRYMHEICPEERIPGCWTHAHLAFVAVLPFCRREQERAL